MKGANKMRTKKPTYRELQQALAEAQRLIDLHEQALVDLTSRTSGYAVEWIKKGKGDDQVLWGLGRLDGPMGGYVIRQSGPKRAILGVLWLNDLAKQVQSRPLHYQDAVNEAELLTRALNLRSQALDAKYKPTEEIKL